MDPLIVAIAVAAIMSLVAWRVVREERQRSEARISALAADIHGNDFASASDLAPQYSGVQGLEPGFALQPRHRAVATLIGAAALVVGSIVVMALVTRGAYSVASGRASTDAAQASRLPPRAVAEPPMLELVVLSHEREGDRLTVRGIVRNPARTAGARHLSAVVLLFNGEGRFLTSGRAAVNTDGLAPGTEAAFVVTVPGAAEVGRYRVSFRSDDRVVPHVDRRR